MAARMEPLPAYDVFVSYSRRDEERVGLVVRSLEQAGVRVWRDNERIQGGEYYGESIAAAIRASKVVIVMCSPHSLQSDEVHNEITLTWGQAHRNYLPLWLVKPFPYPDRFAYCLAKYQWIEVTDRPAQDWMPNVLSAPSACWGSGARKRSRHSVGMGFEVGRSFHSAK